MFHLGNRENDERREGGEAEGRKPPAEPFYDPLLNPWQDPLASMPAEEEKDPLSLDLWPLEDTPLPGPAQLPPRPQGEVPPSAGGRPSGPPPLEQAVALPQPWRRRWGTAVRELAETLLLALLIFLAVRASFQNFRVEGASMMPNLDNGEYLIVNKLAYARIDLSIFDWLPFFDAGDNPVRHLWAAPARGDVIVFRSPTNLKRDFIKRIIGVPGDTVEIIPETGEVLVNGEVIDEPYVQGRTYCRDFCGPWTVPAGHYFVMGDNRQNSSDSRQGWYVPEENIIGKALITYWNDGQPELELAPNYSIKFASEARATEH